MYGFVSENTWTKYNLFIFFMLYLWNWNLTINNDVMIMYRSEFNGMYVSPVSAFWLVLWRMFCLSCQFNQFTLSITWGFFIRSQTVCWKQEVYYNILIHWVNPRLALKSFQRVTYWDCIRITFWIWLSKQLACTNIEINLLIDDSPMVAGFWVIEAF